MGFGDIDADVAGGGGHDSLLLAQPGEIRARPVPGNCSGSGWKGTATTQALFRPPKTKGASVCRGPSRRYKGAASEYPDEALGRSQGGFSTKIHLRAEGSGKPIALLITAGQRHEQVMFEALMETGTVKRAERGRPRIRPDRVA